MITYTRNEDGTYTKAGEFAEPPKAVRISMDDGQPFPDIYTLEAATTLIENTIANQKATKAKYSIFVEEKKVKAAKAPKEPKESKAPKEPKTPKEPKVPKVPKEKKVKEPKGPRKTKYDQQQFLAIYALSKSIDEVRKATGASAIYVKWILTKNGVYEKPARKERALRAAAECCATCGRRLLKPKAPVDNSVPADTPWTPAQEAVIKTFVDAGDTRIAAIRKMRAAEAKVMAPAV